MKAYFNKRVPEFILERVPRKKKKKLWFIQVWFPNEQFTLLFTATVIKQYTVKCFH